MGAVTYSGIVIFTAILYSFMNDRLYSKHPKHIDGYTHPAYEKVKKAFFSNFEDDWEPEGAAFSVYVDGKKVVDLWGGYADKQAARKWTQDTITVTFSTTKAASALAVAILAQRGRLSYDDPVSKYWPGFARHGRENVTIQMALSHMAGMAYLNTPITEDIALDHNKIREIFEEEEPKWIPGTKNGYHVYTYGWLLDQIVRHTDEQKRGIGQFFREEIASKNDIDFHIGLPRSEQYRVARIATPTIAQRVAEMWTDLRVVKYLANAWKLVTDSPLAKSVNNPSWLQAVHKCTINNPDYHRLEQAAALGIGNARSLASLFDKFQQGHIVNTTMVQKLSTHYTNETDVVFGDQVAKGHGFFYFPIHRAGTEFGFGHTGHGCQQVITDLKNRVTIAYVSNGLKTGLYDLCRTYWRLQTAVYDVIENSKSLSQS